jgi:flagellar basal body-associated protein FliL
MPDAQENLADQEQPKKKGRTKSLIVLLLFACLAGAGGFVFWRRSTAHQRQQVAEKPKIKEVLHLEGFVVNLADRENHAFLRIGIDLGLYEAKKSGAEGPNPVPLMRDSILSVVGAYKSDELLTSEGKSKLKRELVAALQQRVPEARVGDVYFTEFLVQQ